MGLRRYWRIRIACMIAMIAFAVCVPCILAARGRPHDRLLAHQQASEAFLHLNFFTEGRGMHAMPRVVGIYESLRKSPTMDAVTRERLTKRWGMQFFNDAPVGLFPVDYKGMKIAVFGCALCHCGRAAGQFIVGLGNKNIDEGFMGHEAYALQRVYRQAMGWPTTNPEYAEIERSSLEFVAKLSDARLDNMTQGLVPVGVIFEWFYDQAGTSMGSNPNRALVKAPALWGYAEKNTVGKFCDGMGAPGKSAWESAVELVGGQRPETVRQNFQTFQVVEDMFADFLPPRYPYEVDAKRAAHGKDIFQQSCAGCHGNYTRDSEDLPIFAKPKLISVDRVKTDPDRLDGVTDQFRELVAISPLNDLIKMTDYRRKYFAPRLDGIWCRFPYLHNASVPNLAAMLTLPEDRPKVFSLENAGEAERFDSIAVGLTMCSVGSQEEVSIAWRGRRGDRDVYDASRPGHSNQGHPFGIDLEAAEKMDLIEYLKTL